MVDTNDLCPSSVKSYPSTVNEVRVFPNPTRETVTINSAVPITDIVIYDVWGRQLKAINGLNGLSQQIDLTQTPSGILVLDIHINSKELIRTMVIHLE